MSFDTYTKVCRQLDSELPDGWEVYSAESLPKDITLKPKDRTHLELKGSVPRERTKGRLKGQKIWTPRVSPKTFIVSFEDIAKAKQGDP